MCECGCTSGNERYRLAGPAGVFYIIEIYPGCRNCTAPPGITIYKITKEHHDREFLLESPPLNFNKWNGMEECPIVCGLDPDDFREMAVEEITAYAKDAGIKRPDADDAHEIADQLWGAAVHGTPQVVIANKPIRKKARVRR